MELSWSSIHFKTLLFIFLILTLLLCVLYMISINNLSVYSQYRHVCVYNKCVTFENTGSNCFLWMGTSNQKFKDFYFDTESARCITLGGRGEKSGCQGMSERKKKKACPLGAHKSERVTDKKRTCDFIRAPTNIYLAPMSTLH